MSWQPRYPAADLPPPPPPPPPLLEPPVEPPPVDAVAPPVGRTPPLRRLLVAGLTFVLVAGAAAGGISAFRFFRGAGDQLISLAPDDTLAYATAYLDPSGSQKLAVSGLLGKFPHVSTPSELDATVNRLLDGGLRGSGLDHNDIRPWLGSQIALLVSAQSSGGSHQPMYASLVSTTDSGKTLAAVQKFEGSTLGRQYAWSTQQHDGVTLYVGQQHDTGELNVYAVVNGSLVFTNSAAYADEIIDTANGAHASLTGSADYVSTLSQLPADKLALAYIDVPKFAALLGSGSGLGFPLSGVQQSQAELGGYRGAGFALSAQSDGVAIDGVVDYDSSKMSAQSRAVAQVAPDRNSTLGFVPQSAYGFYALDGLPQIVRSALDLLGSSAGAFGQTVDPLLGHLTGDAAVEVQQPAGLPVPGGALLVATDSDASARRLISAALNGVCGPGFGCAPTTQVYRGTQISTMPLSTELGFAGLAPSWAVAGRMAILATSPQEVEAVLDAHATGGVQGAARFSSLIQHADSTDNALFYLDLGSIATAIRDALPPVERGQYDSQVAPYLDHFKGLVMSSTNGAGRTTLRSFIEVQ